MDNMHSGQESENSEAAVPQHEHSESTIDLQEELEEVLGKLSYGERSALEHSTWEDSRKKWKDGFLDFLKRNELRGKNAAVSLLKAYVKNVKKSYEETSYSEDPETKKLYKTQLAIAEKMLGLYSPETKKNKELSHKEKVKSIYSKENVLFTLRNIRRQIFELVGLKDPWFDYSQLQQGTSELEGQMGGKGQNASQLPVPRQNETPPMAKPSQEPAVPEHAPPATDEGGEEKAA